MKRQVPGASSKLMNRPIKAALGCILMTGFFAGTFVPCAVAEIYRWTDDSGREHFTQDLSRVPATLRRDAERRASEPVGQINVIPSTPRHSTREPLPAAGHLRTDSDTAAPTTRRLGPLVELRGGRDEAWWRREWQRQVNTVATLERKLKSIEESSAAPSNVDYSWRARSGNKDRQRYERNKQRRDNQRARAKAAAKARSALANAERLKAQFAETARRAGVPPGWIRE
jgi:hypothetical protein